MDLTSFISILVVIAIAYFFLKLIVSPILKAILGVITFIVLLYLFQKFLGFDLDKVFKPFGLSLNPEHWGLNLDWLVDPVNSYVEKIKSFLKFIWASVPKP